MQAYEFYTTAENGVIRIPDNYKKIIGSKFKVIIIEDKKTITEKQITLEELKQLRGIVRSDIDEKTELAKSREERYADFG